MEIVLPFSDTIVVSDRKLEDINYMAILSRDSLFFTVSVDDEEIINYGKMMVKDISLSKSSKLQSAFNKITLAFNNPIYTFVPVEDYNEEHLSDYLTFSNHLTDIEKYKFESTYLDRFSMWMVYALPKAIHKSLHKYLGPYHHMHYQSCFLSSLKSDNSAAQINVSLIGNNLNLALLKEDKLLMSNTYSANNESEMYYFIALLYDQFDLKKGEVLIYLQGDFQYIEFDKNRFHQLFGVYPEYLNQNGTSQKFETSTSYVPLIDLNRCVSSLGR